MKNLLRGLPYLTLSERHAHEVLDKNQAARRLVQQELRHDDNFDEDLLDFHREEEKQH